MGFGCWQWTCSWLGVLSKFLTNLQKIFPCKKDYHNAWAAKSLGFFINPYKTSVSVSIQPDRIPGPQTQPSRNHNTSKEMWGVSDLRHVPMFQIVSWGTKRKIRRYLIISLLEVKCSGPISSSSSKSKSHCRGASFNNLRSAIWFQNGDVKVWEIYICMLGSNFSLQLLRCFVEQFDSLLELSLSNNPCALKLIRVTSISTLTNSENLTITCIVCRNRI